MTVEEAIVTALEYEQKVRDHYALASRECADAKGKEFFALLAREEQGHVDYLKSRLAEWKTAGALSGKPLETVLPSKDFLAKGMALLRGGSAKGAPEDDVRRLHAALRLEDEVTAFYRSLVASLEEREAREMFQRFLDIEDGHTALVQAETDAVTRTGYFFDFQEFNQDG